MVVLFTIGRLVQLSGRRRRLQAELQVLLMVAAGEAARLRHPAFTAEHIAWALLAAPEVSRAMHARGLPVAALQSALETKLAELPPRAPDAPKGMPASPEALRIARVAFRLSMASADAGRMLESLVRALLHEKGTFACELLTKAGIDDDWSLQAQPVQLPGAALLSTRGQPYRGAVVPVTAYVVFWNDDKSTMEGVVAVLREVFAMGEPEARYVMFLVHKMGRAIAHATDDAEATVLAGRATEAARQRGMPLRVTVEKASPKGGRAWLGWIPGFGRARD